jgi:RNA polymerase sigma-70 factor (ECF subfamily)
MATVGSVGHGDGRGGMTTLILAARNEGPAALGRLLDAAYGYLTFLAVGRMGREYSAKFGISDIVQESVKDAQRAFDGFEGGSTGEFFAWLRRIVHSNVRDEERKHARAVGFERPLDALPPIAVSGDVEARAMQGDLAAMIEECLARLPEQHAAVLRFRYWEGLTFPEIGLRMGRSDEAVRKLWVRSLDRLREECPGIEGLDR